MNNLHIYCGAVYLAFGVVSLIINLLLLVVLIKGNREFKKSSFFILTWQLLIFDFIALITHLFLAAPTNIAGFEVIPYIINYSICIAKRLSYYGTLLFAVLLTINRFMLFVFPKTNERIFGFPEIYYTIVFGWIVLSLFIAVLTLGGTYNFYDAEELRLTIIKNENRPWWSLNIFEPIEYWFSQAAPTIMIIIYVLTFLEIKFHFYKRIRYGNEPDIKKTASSKKGEMKVLLQCFIICSVFQIEWFTYNLLPQLPSILPWTEDFIGTISSCMSVCMCTVHSIVVFTFTTKARQILVSILTGKIIKGRSTTTVVSIIAKKTFK